MSKMHYCEKTKCYVKCSLPDYCECQSKTKSDLTSENQIKKIIKDETPQKYPTYENELSLFIQELKRNLEEFRRERAEWGMKDFTAELDAKTINESLEEEISSNVYKGRFILLRKMGFKIDRIRTHHQTLRPLKYYTLKPVPLELPKRQKSIELLKTKGSGQKEEGKRREQDVCKKSKKKKFKITAKSKIELKSMDTAKWILEKLKAKNRGRKTELESCRCEDGKEVTFIIKGVCLCDQDKMKNFKTDHSSSKNKSKANEENFRLPFLSDSLELHRKKMKAKNSDELKKKSVRYLDNVNAEKKDSKKPKRKTSFVFKFKKNGKNSKEPKEPNEPPLESVQKPPGVEKPNKTSLGVEKTEKETEGSFQERLPPDGQNQEVGGGVKGIEKDDSASRKPPSLVTLYKNQNTVKKSDLGLTKEEKKIIDKYNKKREKVEHEVMELIR